MTDLKTKDTQIRYQEFYNIHIIGIFLSQQKHRDGNVLHINLSI